ncbi:MAG: hypothetical protein Q3986_02815 [Akkermansia sp.]|nr:hypothetical protein [Akkermansia sp.]
MKALTLTLCAALMPLGSACAADTPATPAAAEAAAARDAVLGNTRKQVDCIRELRDALALVQDKAAADAAAPKVKEIVERMVQLQEDSQKMDVEADDALLQEALKMLQDEPATEALPLIINMLHDSDYHGSAALREALAPVIGDSVGQ